MQALSRGLPLLAACSPGGTAWSDGRGGYQGTLLTSVIVHLASVNVRQCPSRVHQRGLCLRPVLWGSYARDKVH